MELSQGVVETLREVPESPPSLPLRRLTDPAYADGIAAPRASAADAERVAFEVFTQGAQDIPSPQGLSALWIFWGQFLDHDLDLVPEQTGAGAEFLKFEGEGAPFNLVRSLPVEGASPREQPNAITPLIDASQVYGSDAFRAALLRQFEGGRLQSRPGPDGVDLLPQERELFAPFLDYVSDSEAFAAGDIRVSENPGLSSVHALWLNEHNHWAGRLAAMHPDWSDDALYASARAIVETLVQKITYEEFLPPLIGDALAGYAGFDPEADPQVSTEFATAAFRFGHTAIPDRFTFVTETGEAAAEPLPLFLAFENDAVLSGQGVPDTLRGLLEERAQTLDAKVVDSLNLLLFTPDGGLTGFSLPERNILRGRDHGIDTYLNVRAQVVGDIDPAAVAPGDFSVITADPAVQAALAGVYDSVQEVDLWVGGLAEDKPGGLALGPTFGAILAEQFTASRDGDPLFYLSRAWTDPLLAQEVLATRLSDVLMRSGGIDHVQAEAMRASDRLAGGEGADYLRGAAGRDLMIGLDGADYLKGLAGDDDLFGDAGTDKLRGAEGADVLRGGEGHDKLMGGAGDDTLAGGPGNDVLIGGPGRDVFVLVAGEDGVDSLTDFAPGEDLIELRGFGGVVPQVELHGMMASLVVDDAAIAHLWQMGDGALTEADLVLIG